MITILHIKVDNVKHVVTLYHAICNPGQNHSSSKLTYEYCGFGILIISRASCFLMHWQRATSAYSNYLFKQEASTIHRGARAFVQLRWGAICISSAPVRVNVLVSGQSARFCVVGDILHQEQTRIMCSLTVSRQKQHFELVQNQLSCSSKKYMIAVRHGWITERLRLIGTMGA